MRLLALLSVLSCSPPRHATRSCVSPWDGSIADIVRRGVPASKIVVGKIITPGDGNSGYVPLSSFASFLSKAVAKYPTLAGAFGWQWGSDTKGTWAKTVAR